MCNLTLYVFSCFICCVWCIGPASSATLNLARFLAASSLLRLMRFAFRIAFFLTVLAFVNYKQYSHKSMETVRPFALDKRLFNSALYSNVIDVWLAGVPPRATHVDPKLRGRWFGVGVDAASKAHFDCQCHAACSEALRSIGPETFQLPKSAGIEADRTNYANIARPFVGELDGSDSNAKADATDSALGLTLLLDQIPRNVFRDNQALIYGHYDRISRAVTTEIYARKLDRHERFVNSPPWRIWFYMPLEHSEALADHETMQLMLADMQARAEERNDTKAMEYLEEQTSFEMKHAQIIRQFGRFPHRSTVLGRKSTPEEKQWLENGGDTFGAG